MKKNINWKDLSLRMLEDFNDWDCFPEDACNRVSLKEYEMLQKEMSKRREQNEED